MNKGISYRATPTLIEHMMLTNYRTLLRSYRFRDFRQRNLFHGESHSERTSISMQRVHWLASHPEPSFESRTTVRASNLYRG